MSATEFTVPSAPVRVRVAAIFEALGLPAEPAREVADALVDADEEGLSSHGVMLVPMYVERIRAGSVTLATEGRVVSDRDGSVVIDAGHALGQLTSLQAVGIAADRARRHGLAAVAVRNAFHFGTAGRWALALAGAGCAGIVMCSTRPLMPAPGGAERLVGNNPLAIAMPSADDGPPAVLDMATSASAMGKIRFAEGAGRTIPADWATDDAGRPTTDPAAAIRGMLLPAAGPKGFGLAFMIDLLCGGLSSGATGDDVRPLYLNEHEPYNCAHLFLALDVGHFRDPDELASTVSAMKERVRNSRTAPGTDRIMSPGEPEWRRRREANGTCALSRKVLDDLDGLAADLGLVGSPLAESG